MARRFLVLPLLCLLAACGAPAAVEHAVTSPGPNPAEVVALLPPQLGTFRRTGEIVDYERNPGGGGLGASARYVPANGEHIVMTFYVYDGGRHREPEGGSSADVAKEVAGTGAELAAMVRMRRYRSSAFDSGMEVGPLSRPDSARCATFRVVQGDGAPTGDAVCVSVLNGRFLKVRATLWAQPEPNVAGLAAFSMLNAARGALTRTVPRT